MKLQSHCLTLRIKEAKRQYPVKRRQALLGSNLPRDSRMQVALNNAPEGRGFSAAFPPP